MSQDKKDISSLRAYDSNAILMQWRERLLRWILQGGLILGLISFVPSIISELRVGGWQNIIILSIFLITVIIIAFVRFPYHVRAGLLLLLATSIFINSLLRTGIHGEARIYFVGLTMLGLIFYGIRFGVGTLIVSLFSIAIVGWGAITHRIPISLPIDQLTASAWIDAAASMLLVTGLLMLSVVLLENQFITAQARGDLALQEIQNERRLLEKRVVERTQDLTLAAEVGRIISQQQDLNTLLLQAVNLITTRFNLYYSQIYLVDPDKKVLLLEAGSGAIGEELLRFGHRLPIDINSINGRSVTQGAAVVVPDTTASYLFRPNPRLPETRSEMAVPLISGNTVLGVLDMQSRKAGDLSQENLSVYETLAGQLTAAIMNARLFKSAQQARSAVEAQLQRFTRDSWSTLLDGVHRGENISYTFSNSTFTVTPESLNLSDTSTGLKIPVKISGQSIGSIIVERDPDQAWTIDDEELVYLVADQVARRLDDIRLLEQAERFRLEAETATRLLTRSGWDSFTSSEGNSVMSYMYDGNLVQRISTIELDPGMVHIPLQMRGEQIGELIVQGSEKLDRTANEQLARFTERLMAHLENLRLSIQTQKALAETDTLFTISADLNAATSYLNVLDAIIKRTVLDRADRSTMLFVFDQPIGLGKSAEWAFPVATHSAEAFEVSSRYPLSAFEINPGTIFTNKAVVLENIETDARLDRFTRTFFQEIFAAKSAVIVPLILGEQVIGFILGNYGKEFTAAPSDIDLLTSIAGQAAISVQGLQLLERTQARAQREQLLREITAQVTSATDVDTIMRRTVEELGRAIKQKTFIILSPGSPDKNDSQKSD